MDFELFYQGQERDVYVYDSVGHFRKWMEVMDRPPMRVLIEAIDWLGDRPLEYLLRGQRKWIPVKGSSPKLFELRKDQARLYCCMKDGDVYILDWVQKKQQRAPKNAIARAERRANEILKHG